MKFTLELKLKPYPNEDALSFSYTKLSFINSLTDLFQ